MIDGVGQEAEVVSNEKGGLGSKMKYAFDLIPPEAMFKLAAVIKYGADKYSPNNWRLLYRHEHLGHALQHIFAYMAGDTQDDHMGHALCRIAMAASVEEKVGHSYTQPEIIPVRPTETPKILIENKGDNG